MAEWTPVTPMPIGQRMGSATINGRHIELRMHDDAGLLAFAAAEVAAAAEESENQKRELLALMSATLWVLEHPDVNAIRFCGDPRELAKRIRAHMAKAGMGVDAIRTEGDQHG